MASARGHRPQTWNRYAYALNVGSNFDRVAETKKQELEAQGYEVTVARVSSVSDVANALSNNGRLNGVEYLGPLYLLEDRGTNLVTHYPIRR